MSEKIIQLEYVAPRCAGCGRDLPKGRKRKCFYCLSPKGFRCMAAEKKCNSPYTLEDRVAQAEAYGMSYGRFMAAIENKWPLPPQKKPVQWPLGSEHWGEIR